MFPNGLEMDLYKQCGDELSCRKVGLGKYRGTTMKSKKRDWNGVVKS